MALKADDIAWDASAPREEEAERRIFRERGEGKYSLEILPLGLTFEVDRIRRDRDGMVGELVVSVSNGKFPSARTYNNVLSIGDLNFSAVRSRTERANLLSKRSGVEHLDWFGYLEEFCVRTMETERNGKPAVILADVNPKEDRVEEWVVEGFPVLAELPMVLFGDAASGKSYFAMWLAGKLAQQGIPVMYADWELSEIEHRKRLAKLFDPMPRDIHYVRCEYPLSQQTDRLLRVAAEHKCKYAICDSIGFALDAAAETQESAMRYFRCLRQLRVGTLNLAHIPKQYDDSREASIFGSVFFKAGARSAWFVDKATNNPKNEIRFGLHHRKSNVGPILPSRGYRLVFEGKRTTLASIDIKSVDELQTSLPLFDRVKILLHNGALTQKQIADELGVNIPALRNVFSRHKDTFVKMGNKFGVVAEGVDF